MIERTGWGDFDLQDSFEGYFPGAWDDSKQTDSVMQGVFHDAELLGTELIEKEVRHPNQKKYKDDNE